MKERLSQKGFIEEEREKIMEYFEMSIIVDDQSNFSTLLKDYDTSKIVDVYKKYIS